MRERRGRGTRGAGIVAAAALLVMAGVGKCDLPQPKIGPLGAAAGAASNAAVSPHGPASQASLPRAGAPAEPAATSALSRDERAPGRPGAP